MASYPLLFQPFSAGRLSVANRLVVLPHGTFMVRDGAITDDNIAYWETRARSGVGLIITGGTIVHETSSLGIRGLVEAYDQRVIEGLAKRSDAVHAHGAKLVGQLFHFGREIYGETLSPPYGPSPIRSPRDPFPPHELATDEIAAMVAAFAAAAVNLQRARYDGVEIHGAHGYLVAQFLSPATNHRNDAYGGTPEKRLRFLREIIEAIRTRCGNDFILGLRLSGDEEIADGNGVADTVKISRAVAGYRAVDYLNITYGVRGNYVKDASAPKAPAARAAKLIREASGLPIIVGQKITTPEMAEAILADGAADLVGMVRAFLADPEWVQKAARGEADRIRPCIGVNQECRTFMPHVHCSVNPGAGREALPEFNELGTAPVARRVAVIGGGPGGLEAARVAASRGHAVTLFEATDGIGGQFLYAAAVPHRADLKGLIDFEQRELRRLGVKIELGAKVTSAKDLGAAFDVAVVATGATARPLDEGMKGPGVVSWFDILAGGAPAPEGEGRAVFVDDGSGFWWTYGVAEILAEAGWRLLLATPGAAVGANIPAESVGPLLARLGKAGSEYRVLSTLTEIGDGAAHFLNLTSGKVEQVSCNLIVVQTGRMPVPGPVDALKKAGIETYTIGDCVTPRRMSHAVFEAYRRARQL